MKTYCCPTKPQAGVKDDILGCGHKFQSEPDHEDFVDCPNCGIFFKADQGRTVVSCRWGCGRQTDLGAFPAGKWTCAACYAQKEKQ